MLLGPEVITPYMQTPLTDITAAFAIGMGFEKCSAMEMRAANCLEAYGYEKGQTKCKDYVEDLFECVFMQKEMAHFNAVRKERERQYRRGTLKEQWAPAPKLDAY